MGFLKDSLDKLWETNQFLGEFEKEYDNVVFKYNKYKEKMDEFLAFQWPTEEQYKAWDDKYNNFPNL